MLRHIIFTITTILLQASMAAYCYMNQYHSTELFETYGLVTLFGMALLWVIVTFVMCQRDIEEDVWS